jgi:hypothetical protein
MPYYDRWRQKLIAFNFKLILICILGLRLRTEFVRVEMR